MSTMSKNKPAKAGKLPRAQVRYWLPSDTKLVRSYSAGANFGAFKMPCAVIPTRTRKEAAALVKLFTHGPSEEAVKNIAIEMDFMVWERAHKHPKNPDAVSEWNDALKSARAMICKALNLIPPQGGE